MQNRHNKQQGIVLISSLIFLILILGLLRVTLGTSQLMERKSGIDYDVMRATEHSNNGLREIENKHISKEASSTEKAQCKGDSACEETLTLQKTIDFWANNANLDKNKGYYLGNSNDTRQPAKLTDGTEYIIERFTNTDLKLSDTPFILLRVTTTGFGLQPDHSDENVTKVKHEALYVLAGSPSTP